MESTLIHAISESKISILPSKKTPYTPSFIASCKSLGFCKKKRQPLEILEILEVTLLNALIYGVLINSPYKILNVLSSLK